MQFGPIGPRAFPVASGTVIDTDRSSEILDYFRREQIDALVSVGGDGSLTISNELHRKGLRDIQVEVLVHANDVGMVRPVARQNFVTEFFFEF
jgi:hypothetical protein